MATLYLKYAKKCEKKFILQIIGEGAWGWLRQCFFLSRQKILNIIVGFWSRAIALSDLKNFWFFELSGSLPTTMSPNTFLYLVTKFSKLWSDFGRGRYHCTKPLFSISPFKKSNALTIDRNV